MRIVLFVNDSYFAYFLARPIIEKFHNKISVVIFSRMIKGSISRIYNVYKKTYLMYFSYRFLIEIITRINAFRGQKTVISLVEKYNLQFFSESNVNISDDLDSILPCDLGIAFNYDQVLKKKLLNAFRIGVVNIHASKLPNDKGISPVLWAFARGDNFIWSTIYRMEAGIDTGLVYFQNKIPVKKNDTAFSLYERVCSFSGNRLAELIYYLNTTDLKPLLRSTNEEGNYFGWPDLKHKEMMNRSKRYFINYRDILRAFKRERATVVV